jgi:hypothetical protein
MEGNKTVTNVCLQQDVAGRTLFVWKEQFLMKLRHASAFVILTLFASHSARAADWEVVASPNLGRQANTLLSVAAAADNDVWAVGAAYNSRLAAYRTVIERWNGMSWSVVPSPNSSTGYNLLNGVAVVAATNVWAVGQAAHGNIYRTLVEHWNGTTWRIVPSPNVTGNSSVLQAISVVSANDIWAVGFSSDASFNDNPLITHWNGTTWSIVPSPSVNDDVLFAVDAVAANDVWAVGKSQNEARTLTLHWNGSAWRVVPSPNDTTNDNALFGVAAVAHNDVWAVGNAGSLKTLAIHWDGASWSVVPTPPFNSNTNNEVLVGIVALASDNIWAAGQFLLPLQGSAQQTLTENWNGASWSVVASPNAKNSNNRLHGITATPNGTLWTVGTTGVFTKPERTLILRNNP